MKEHDFAIDAHTANVAIDEHAGDEPALDAQPRQLGDPLDLAIGMKGPELVSVADVDVSALVQHGRTEDR